MFHGEYKTKSGATVKIVTDGGIKNPGRRQLRYLLAGEWFVKHNWLGTQHPVTKTVTPLPRDEASRIGNWTPFVMGSRILKNRRKAAKKAKHAAARRAAQPQRDARTGRRLIGPVTSCAELKAKAQALPRRLRRAVLVDAGLL